MKMFTTATEHDRLIRPIDYKNYIYSGIIAQPLLPILQLVTD